VAEKLKTWPQCYLKVRGNTSSRGDPEANKKLAKARAQVAVDYLLNQKGVSPNRIRGESGQSNGSTTVDFVLGQVPY
jgi:outer membrane protein OmpA-like peptidoglycan-associated protein